MEEQNTYLDREYERQLAIRMKQGDLDASDELAMAQLPFITAFARILSRKTGVEVNDLVQEGYSASIMPAMEKYDPSREASFKTYSQAWYRRIFELARRQRDVRFSTHTNSDMRRAKDIIASAKAKDGETEKTDEEILRESEQMEGKNLERILNASRIKVSSIYARASGNGTMIIDTLPSDSPDSEEEAAAEKMKELVRKAIDQSDLNERDRKIVAMRFGFNGYQEHTLKEIGDLFGITRERARQLEARSLGKIRHTLSKLGTEL